jgi:PKD repeat protein
MNGGYCKIKRLLLVAVGVAAATILVPGLAAGATGAPTAEISINPAKDALTVGLAARSSGFAAAPNMYKWSFGDDSSVTTSGRLVTHTYRKAGAYKVAVTESDTQGQAATATGTLAVAQCGPGASCTESLANVGDVHLLRLSGQAGAAAPASTDLFVGPFQIPDCQLEVAPTAALSDYGFVGDLTVTLKYTTTHQSQTAKTCYASSVLFTDISGKSVTSGALPSCGSKAVAPCVKSTATSGKSVTKVLLIPPGDPKVGAP